MVQQLRNHHQLWYRDFLQLLVLATGTLVPLILLVQPNVGAAMSMASWAFLPPNPTRFVSATYHPWFRPGRVRYNCCLLTEIINVYCCKIVFVFCVQVNQLGHNMKAPLSLISQLRFLLLQIFPSSLQLLAFRTLVESPTVQILPFGAGAGATLANSPPCQTQTKVLPASQVPHRFHWAGITLAP